MAIRTELSRHGRRWEPPAVGGAHALAICIPYMYVVHVSDPEGVVAKAPKRVREQAVVYLGRRDRALLDDLTNQTGLSQTELFRRGLWALASQLGVGQKPGSAFEYLIRAADQWDAPADFAERSDDYMYGDGHSSKHVSEAPVTEPGKRRPKKRARAR